MVVQTTLSLSIDASEAKRGAVKFSRAADDIKKKAAEMGRAVGKAGSSFDTLKKAANDNSQTLAKTAQSLRDVEIAVNSLSRSAGQVRTLRDAFRDLSDAAATAGRRINEAASSSNNLTDNLRGKPGKDVPTLTDLYLQLGGSILLLAGAQNAIKAFRLASKFSTLIGKMIKYVVAVNAARKAVGLLSAVIRLTPLGVAFSLVTAAAAAFLTFRSSTSDATSAAEKYKIAVESTNAILLTAAERQRELNRERKEGAIADTEAAIAALENQKAILADRLSNLDARFESPLMRVEEGSLNNGETARDLLKRNIEATKNRSAEIDKLLADAKRRLEATKAAPDSPQATNTAAEKLERSFAGLQERLDPLGVATQAYGDDLKLLKAAEEAGLITEARQLELRGKLETATLDARDPVAALRRELEQERNQLMMTDDEREISTRLLEIEARLKTAGVNVSDELRQSLESELIAVQKLRKGRDEAGAAEKKSDDEREQRKKDAAEKMDRRVKAADEVIKEFKDAAKDSFKDVIKGTESVGDAFQKLADRIQEKLLDLALDELLSGGTGFSDVFAMLTGGVFGGLAPANDNKKDGGIAAKQPALKLPEGGTPPFVPEDSGGGLGGIIGSLLGTVFGGGGGTTQRPLDKCCENFEDFGREWLTDLNGVGDGVAGKLEEVFVEDGGGWTEKAGEVFEGPGRDFLGGLGNIFDDGISGLSDILSSLFSGGGSSGGSDLFGSLLGAGLSAFGGGGGGLGTSFLTGLPGQGTFDIGSPFHKGGVVGFDGRPRYHDGGVAGLRPDEVPALLQRGEEVLTAKDPRHRDNAGAGGGNVVVNVTFPNARNTDEARQAGSEIAAKAAAAAQRGMVRKGIG